MVLNIFKKKKIKEEPQKEIKVPKEEHTKRSREDLESEIKIHPVIEITKEVTDPELGIDIWTLGLIYDIKLEEKVKIILTLTSPMCPFGPQILGELKQKLEEKGYKDPTLTLTFNPPWAPDEELRAMLGV